MKIYHLTLLIATVILSGCNNNYTNTESNSRPAKFYTISNSFKSNVRNFPATLEAGQRAVMSFRVAGKIDELNVKSGDYVSRGNTLAAIESDEHALILEKAKANYDLAYVQYDRVRKLRRDRVVSEQDYEQALANYDSAKANFQQAKLNLGFTELIAPFDGQVSMVHVEKHEFVQKEQIVLSLHSTDTIKARFYVPASILNVLKSSNSLKPTLKLDSWPDQRIPLHSLEVDTESEQSTNTYKITMAFKKPHELNINPGMSGYVEIPTKPNILKLPDSSYFHEGHDTYVWRVKPDGSIEKVKVDINNSTLESSGLRNNDVIISSGVNDIDESMKIHEWVKERGI